MSIDFPLTNFLLCYLLLFPFYSFWGFVGDFFHFVLLGNQDKEMSGHKKRGPEKARGKKSDKYSTLK